MSEDFLALCLALSDYRLDTSLSAIIERAEQYQKTHNCTLMGVSEGNFRHILVLTPHLETGPEAQYHPAVPSELVSTTLGDVAARIIEQLRPRATDTDICWVGFTQRDRPSLRNRRFRAAFAEGKYPAREVLRDLVKSIYGNDPLSWFIRR